MVDGDDIKKCTLWEPLWKDEEHNNPTDSELGDKVIRNAAWEVEEIIIDWDHDFEIIEWDGDSIVLLGRFKHKHSWKVRETYENPDNENELIMIATDRISTHDVVHDSIIQWKWKSLTQISNFWFDELKNAYPTNHIRTQIVENPIWPEDFPEELKERSVIVKKLKALPIEAIVRWYLYWSALKGYNAETWLLATWEDIWRDLKKCSKFEEPRFTPSTKSDSWDKNVDFVEMINVLSGWLLENGYQNINPTKLANQIKEYSILMYNHANKIAQEKWIIIWDTKFEFWLDKDWNLTVIDEVLTPDSSRFWTKKGFQEWVEPESFDKQPVRDYVEAYWKENSDENWKKLWEKGFKKYPVELPQEVIEACQERYIKMWIVFS